MAGNSERQRRQAREKHRRQQELRLARQRQLRKRWLTGFSAVVTQRGVVVQRSVLGRRQVLFATVSLRRGMTPYDHWGDLPVLFLSALALVAGWARQLRYS